MGAQTMAAVIFKNTLINATRQENGDGVWYRVNQELRGHIKDALLTILQNQDRDALKNASISLGIIAAIEVPDGQWDQFL